MLIAALFGSSFVAVRFVESGVITKNWRKVPAVKKIDQLLISLLFIKCGQFLAIFMNFLAIFEFFCQCLGILL